MDVVRIVRSALLAFALLALLSVARRGDAAELALPAGLLDGRAGRGASTARRRSPTRPTGACSSRRRPGACGSSTPDGRLQPDPVIDIRDHVNAYWDRGLLGIAVDADFAANHFLYLLYVNEANALNPSGAKTSRLTRITVTSANRPENPDAPETILLGAGTQAPCPAPTDTVDCIPADGFSHSIGTVRADPDGTLWLGSGDASGFRGVDPKALRTYDEHSFAGKLIHVDRDGRGLPGHPFCPGETDLTQGLHQALRQGLPQPVPVPAATRRRPARRRRRDGTAARSSTRHGRAAATGGRATRARTGRRATRIWRAAPPSTTPGRRRTIPPALRPTRTPGGRGDRGRPALRGRAVPGRLSGRVVLRRLREGRDLAHDDRRAGRGLRRDRSSPPASKAASTSSARPTATSST